MIETTRPPAMSPGRFIALEGIDGAGKSSQIAALVAWLGARGRRVVTCRDPGSTAAGDAIRAILLDRHDLHLAPSAEMLLYMAARAQLVSEVIAPAVARGDWVVSDRYLLSNIVYQGHAGGLDPETRPLDKLENRGAEYRRRLRVGYHAEAARSPETIAVVDARADRDTVAAAVRTAVATRFPDLE